MREVISSVYSADVADRFPLLRQPESVKRAAIVLITSVAYVIVAFLVDFVYQLVDPRTRA